MKKQVKTTVWTEQVNMERPLEEYPRPQMVRKEWLNLNGQWDFYIGEPKDIRTIDFNKEILVPFCVESYLSGIQEEVLPDQRLVYRRSFTVPQNWDKKNVLLHFGAVDWETTVYLNGNKVGKHIGGYAPFYFDITEFLQEKNELIVEVYDPTDTYWQQKGKQTLNPNGIFYTATSGIWQTVWLEPVSENHLKKIRIIPDIDCNQVKLQFDQVKENNACKEVSIFDQKNQCVAKKTTHEKQILLEIENANYWTPETPYLYNVVIKVTEEGQVQDEIRSYFGMRKFSIIEDHMGRKMLGLNNQILFQNGLLDQGYWPDGIYTAPTDEALKSDIVAAKKLGFNMIRKHIKVEPARWYYWCDKLGIIVWQDMINGGSLAFSKLIPQMMMSGKLNSPENVLIKMQTGEEVSTVEMMAIMLQVIDTIKEDNTQEWYQLVDREDPKSRANFEEELKEMIDSLYNVVSIGMWVPFNESWGQFDAKRIGDWVSDYDKTRCVDYHSGWVDTKGGLIRSFHTYCDKLENLDPDENRAFVISEYGGYTYACEESDEKIFSYGHYDTKEALENAYYDLIKNEVLPLKEKGLTAVVYTQLTDVEGEINGLISYDRKTVKMDADKISKVNLQLIENK